MGSIRHYNAAGDRQLGPTYRSSMYTRTPMLSAIVGIRPQSSVQLQESAACGVNTAKARMIPNGSVIPW